MMPIRSAALAAALLAGLWWAMPGLATAQAPPGGTTLSAAFLATPPAIDGEVPFAPAAPWTPLLDVDWSGRSAHARAWARADWSRRGVHLSLALPDARDTTRFVVGMGLPAPFEVFVTIEGGEGEYRLRCVPLVEPVTPMTRRLHAYLFNHRLGANARMGESGHVLCHEISLLGILADSMETRWSAAPDDGLRFEATIPWETLRLPTPAPGAEIPISLEVRQPSGRAVGLDGAMLRLAGAGDPAGIGDPLLVPGPTVRQPDPVVAAYPVSGGAGAAPEFALADASGRIVARAAGETSGDAAFVALATGGVADGGLSLRVVSGGRVVAERPVRLIGARAESAIDSPRERLAARLAELEEGGPDPALAGHIARARRMVELAELPAHADSAAFARSLGLVEDATAAVAALESGRRPDPSIEAFDHPAGFALDGRRGPVTLVPSGDGSARLAVRADRPMDWSLTPRLYGTFSEPVVYDRPIYSWLYAQQLRNPSFEFGHPTAEATVEAFVGYRELEPEGARAALAGEWLPRVPAGVEEVAAPWIGVGGGDVRFETECEAYNDRQCQRVVAGSDARDAGVAQVIELPAWRATGYDLRGYFRSTGGVGEARVALYHDGRPVDSATLSGIDGEWREHAASLTAPRLEGPRNAFLLAITFDGPGALELDFVTLYPDDAVDGFDPQAVEQLTELNTGWVRWPGGNYASDYHWRDGVGPPELRPSTANPSWPGLNPNLVGTDEYLQLAERAGFEVMITVNAGSGTAQEAADWVEYVNGDTTTTLGRLRALNGHPAPYGVRYWNIGNELWGHWQVGYTNPEEYARRYAAFVQAMREVDPSVRIIANAHGGHSESPPEPWNRPLLEHYGDQLEIMDIHTYVGVPDDDGRSPAERAFLLSAIPLSYEQWIVELGEDLRERGLDHVKVIVGEYNARIRSESDAMDRAADLLAYAGYLHAFMRQGDFVVGANATEYSPFNPRALPFDRMHPRYDLFRTYAAHAGTVPVEATLETPVRQQPYRVGRDVLPMFNVPVVDAVALMDPGDGSLGISLINRDVEAPITVRIELDGFRPGPTGRRFVFRGAGGVEEEAIDADGDLTVTLPPHSVSLLELERAGRTP
jgi:alpha-N-arabinofuranosidase